MKAIMYHYVRESDKSFPHFKYLHIEDFRAQLDYFSENFGFVSKEDFLRSLETGVPTDGVVLTFDDGLVDHYNYVLPELLRRKIWGIFYVPSGPCVDKKLLGSHRIHALLGSFNGEIILRSVLKIVKDKMLTFADNKEFQNLSYEGLSDNETNTYIKRVLNYYIDEKHRDKVLDLLMEEFFKSEEVALLDRFYMHPSEIKELSEAGMIVGNHTVNHPVMSKLDYREQRKEICQAFDFLEKILGRIDIKTYCHPHGGSFSFNDHTVKILEKERYLFSFNVENRDIDKIDLKERRYELPRYDCNAFPYGSIRSF